MAFHSWYQCNKHKRKLKLRIYPFFILPNKFKTTKYIKQILTDLKWDIDSNTIILNSKGLQYSTYINRWSPRKNTNKETSVLNDSLDHMSLTDLYRTFHPKATE